jgi:hypothetical protein
LFDHSSFSHHHPIQLVLISLMRILNKSRFSSRLWQSAIAFPGGFVPPCLLNLFVGTAIYCYLLLGLDYAVTQA